MLNEKQQKAVDLKADVTFFGGAAGGGKSHLLAWLTQTNAEKGKDVLHLSRRPYLCGNIAETMSKAFKVTKKLDDIYEHRGSGGRVLLKDYMDLFPTETEYSTMTPLYSLFSFDPAIICIDQAERLSENDFNRLINSFPRSRIYVTFTPVHDTFNGQTCEKHWLTKHLGRFYDKLGNIRDTCGTWSVKQPYSTKKYAFVFANITDNPYIEDQFESNIKALSPREHQRLLHGLWE